MGSKEPTIGIVINSNASTMRGLVPGAGDAEVKVPVELAPAVVGPRGKAWEVDMPALRETFKIPPAEDATIGCWIVEAPWAHPAWHSYLLFAFHLRAVPNRPAAKKFIPLATHEFFLFALHPDAPRAECILGRDNPVAHRMTPPNFAAQYVEIDDDLARGRMVAAMQEICDGKLSPDVDASADWVARFGDSNFFRRG